MLSESIIIWSLVLLLMLILVIPYLIKVRRKQALDYKKKKEAELVGADKPIAQYPQIDYFRCIGCGACVDACPEGGILGIVSGKATIINGLKCVGHGLCAEACPVNGIKVGLGDIKSRDDIPVLSSSNETNIPGIYIAGELTGLALIKNAISQGKKVMDEIAKKEKNKLEKDVLDVIIIGAGPAGLSAALTAIDHKINFLILDQQAAGGTILQYPRKKIVMTRPVEIPLYGWLKKNEYSKEELLEIWQSIQNRFPVNVKINEKLENIKKMNGVFHVFTQKSIYKSKYIVLALGRRGTPRKLNIPGENQSKVMYKLMDAETYQNENILIIGGGDSAVEAAMGLARNSKNSVTISYRKPKFFRIKSRNEERIYKMIEDKKVNVLFNSTITEIGKDNVKIKQDHKVFTLPNSYVFIFAGGEPPFPLMKNIGIKFGGELEPSV